MSVIGIDFGNESCYIAAAKAGGIETLANDYSLRATPSFVAFDGKKRIIGVAAKNQQVTNMKNTVSGFKRLLGHKYGDPHLANELEHIPVKPIELSDGNFAFKVNYLDQEQHFTPEQITAMLFTKLKETSTNALQAQVNDCVITCPVYFTNAERKALLDAAHIAGLNVLRLLNDTTATALSYGFYKQDLPEEKSRIVVFVDIGNTSLQVSACAFTKGKLKMIANSFEFLGGRDFDSILAKHFAKELYDRYKIDAKTNARAYTRLLTECEKIKKQMSANSTKLPLNIECFMNDIDVTSSMQRSTMEELCDNLFVRTENIFKHFLATSKLTLDEIHSVEIVGGSTRIPKIKQIIENVFGKIASTTLNQDESVARGAALQCAIMSPAVRVREFSVTDIQNYAVKVCWEGEGSLAAGEIKVFSAFHPIPFSRLLTLNRKEPFSLTVKYAETVPYADSVIGKWFIKDVKPNDRGEHQEVKVKVRINHHGIVLISSACLVDKKEEDIINSAGGDQIENENIATGEQSQPPLQTQGTATGEPMEVAQEGNEKKKKSSKVIDLPMEFKTHGFNATDLNNLLQQESKMIFNDARETDRVDARNALEEYVYDMRNKLQGGPFERYVIASERDNICSQLNDIETWLYEDGEHCDREVYSNKLSSLHTLTDPIKNRSVDYETCPSAFDELKYAISYARGAVSEFRKGSAKYDHLTETEFINISESADKAQNWLENHYGKFVQSQRTVDSPVKVVDIRREIQSLNSCVNSVINRPKPKPANKTPPKDANNEADVGMDQNGDNDDKMEGGTNSSKNSNNVPEDSTMEVE